MQTLSGKKILIGISGGIAAYKCAELTRRLIERGATVRIAMTDAAKEFITPLTMQALSGYPVASSILDPEAERSMSHIELGQWADLVLLAPATADLIARITAGMADDIVATAVLAAHAQIAIAPAMNQQMYKNLATQDNIETLTRRGYLIWGPAAGEQACGDIGPGRMLEPMQLVHLCETHFAPKILENKSVLITAGPTCEAIDPVRYITNHSSGKMGFALANAAAQMGANVTLIAGPVQQPTPANVTRIDVSSAQQMYDAVMSHASQHDVFISCAAVADYRPESVASQKIKKTAAHDQMTITMVKNPDIVASVASLSAGRPFTVGFAAETQHIEHYARTKLEKKGLNMICANDVSIVGQGFNSNQNALTVYWPDGEKSLALASKSQLATELMTLIHEKIV